MIQSRLSLNQMMQMRLRHLTKMIVLTLVLNLDLLHLPRELVDLN